jgi:hypothetical protein
MHWNGNAIGFQLLPRSDKFVRSLARTLNVQFQLSNQLFQSGGGKPAKDISMSGLQRLPGIISRMSCGKTFMMVSAGIIVSCRSKVD